jgi:5-methylcytosine-specific restriction endonuclease McrBC regulatory subunit McrC
LGTTGYYVQVEPKLNKQSAAIFVKSLDEETLEEITTDEPVDLVELDYLKMFLEVMAVPEAAQHTGGLLQIEWNEKEINIESKDDQLTPLLVVQFLNILKRIVRKGLRKSYYRITENLNSRIKGKILVGQQIKQNVLRNRLTQTICSYESFGTDSAENRFLKKVLQFAISYIENNKAVFQTSYHALEQLIAYCRPAFKLIGDEVEEYALKHLKPNPFFSEYKEGIRIGQLILKRFAYNFTQTAQQQIATPPFWIDMPRLFELYVYSKMVVDNPKEKSHIHYQYSTYGNALDILVSYPGFQMVIDAKYKLHYKTGHLHDDIRQVAGYSRLTKVRKELGVADDRNIDCK